MARAGLCPARPVSAHRPRHGAPLKRQRSGGLFRRFDLLWDGDDNLRQGNELSPTAGTPFTAGYDGAGLRVKETDNWSGTPGTHNFTWGLGGLLLLCLYRARF